MNYAQVYTPRVTTEALPDYTELSRFVNWQKWRDLPEAGKATAIWEFITDKETGLYPIQGIYEDPDPGPAFPFYDERDVIKVLNVHGHGYCGLLSPTLDGLYAAAGFKDSRIHNMDANSHCITEVFYDGGWHYYDVDLRGMLYKPDGTVASIRDAMTIPFLWTAPLNEPFYPLDDKTKMFDSFAPCKLTPMYHWYKNGHTMDFSLRPGESVTRYWQPQGSRWFNPWVNSGGFSLDFIKRKFEQEPRGLKSKHDGWSKWTHGNALFIYAPRLTSAYVDFERGVYDYAGLSLAADGLRTNGADKAYAIFEVRTPYIIVGKVREVERTDRIDNAATLYYRSLGPLKVSVSTDNGLSWQSAGAVEYENSQMLDLTRLVLNRYGYLVRFDFEGKSGLAELALTTWTQLAPVSLPRLFAGENRLKFSLGDRYGQAATVKEIRLNLRDPQALEHCTVSLNADYDPLRDDAKIKGEVVLKIDAKPGTKISWFTAGGYFHTYPGKEAVKNNNAIYYSTADPKGPWTEVVRVKVPDWVLSWHYGMDQDVVLDTPAPTVYLKYVGGPGLNQIWIYAHCLGREASRPAAVRVTHGYELDGELRERVFVFDRETEYRINCPSAPENCFIRFAVDSAPAGKGHSTTVDPAEIRGLDTA